MDNLCHTLAGAAMAEAGLKSRSRFATPALLIAANLPDIDVLVYATSTVPVSFRRGWTHGVLAQALLPVLFAGVLLLWDRWRPARGLPPARAGVLLGIGYAGVLSHVLLDYLNNYGVRLLMPFSSRWFYGDTLFIVDVWLWLLLGGGVYLARRGGTRKHEPTWFARWALVVSAVYILAMLVAARASRQIVLDRWVAAQGSAPASLMVGPRPLTPFSRTIVIDGGNHFTTGTFSWLGPRVHFDAARLPNRFDNPAVRRAREDPTLRAVLVWSRFPYFEEVPMPEGRLVTFTDLRFGPRVGQTTVLVPP
jgi:inner membrane protein